MTDQPQSLPRYHHPYIYETSPDPGARRCLVASFAVGRDGAPLAVLDHLPGEGAELTPAACRALADALVRIADDADRLAAAGVRNG